MIVHEVGLGQLLKCRGQNSQVHKDQVVEKIKKINIKAFKND